MALIFKKINMELIVNEIRQGASGGSFVAIYRATLNIELGDASSQIQVVNTIPTDADPDLLQASIEHIVRGIDSVLKPRGQFGLLVIYDLWIHDTDCNPRKYESVTEAELTKLLTTTF